MARPFLENKQTNEQNKNKNPTKQTNERRRKMIGKIRLWTKKGRRKS